MKGQSWLSLMLGFLLAALLLDACSFSVQVLPTAASAREIPPTSTEAGPTAVIPAETPTLITINIGMVAWLEIFKSIGSGEVLRSVAFTPDNATLASVAGNSEDFAIHLWDVITGQAIGTLNGHRGIVWDVAFSPDGQLLASVSSDGTAKVWEWRKEKELKTLEFPGDVVSVSFSPDGRVLAVGGVDEIQNQQRNAAIWTFSVGAWEPLIKFPEYWSINALAYSPDGKFLVGGGTSRNVQVWKTSDGVALFTLNHAHQVGDAAISPDGSTVATATCETVNNTDCTEGGVWLWSLSTGKLMKQLGDFPDLVTRVAYSSDGSFLIAGSRSGKLRVYETSNYEAWFEATSPGGIEAMSFSPNGSLFATGGTNGLVHLWKVVYRP